MDCKKRIQNILDQLFPICEAWIQDKDGQLYFVDPLDGEEISAHYGTTHMAVAMILYGKKIQIDEMFAKGVKLLESILNRWELSKHLQAYHFDFNNFALCVIEDIIRKEDPKLAERIRQTVLCTADSNHNTTNWLPMRWYVNKKRFKWSNDKKYLKICNSCKTQIEKATNADGGIEDRMPKGMSFNLQYDVATVGVLQFLCIKGEELDLSNELAFLLNAVAPDGDINYQGRGTNQIFAWGLWIYLLASSSKIEHLCTALDYLETKVFGMFQRNNLMLNEWNGAEKHLWWDYHYCSVYSAHFLFWLVLSLSDFGKKEIVETKYNNINDTGLQVYRTDDSFVSVFSGREEYLSEKGPMINAIWTKKYGLITKVSFGPWQGEFGKRYSNVFVLGNYFGLYDVFSLLDIVHFKIIHKLFHYLGINSGYKCRPSFSPLNYYREANKLVFIYNHRRRCRAFLNIPVVETVLGLLELDLFVDNSKIDMYEIGKFRNQFGWYYVFQSKMVFGQNWRLEIKM